MDKGSGVYFTLTDESIQVGGTSSAKLIVLMLTQKGKIGLNRVTAQDFKNKLGYNLGYNPAYLGLSTLIESVSYLDVWRLNQGATHANAYLTGSSWSSLASAQASAQVFAQLASASNGVAVCCTDPGEWGTLGFTIKPKSATLPVQADDTLTVTGVGNFSSTFTLKNSSGQNITLNNNLVVYDALGLSIVAALSNTDNKVYRVDSGIVEEQIGTYTNTSGTVTLTFTRVPNNEPTWTVQYLPTTLVEWTVSLGLYTESTGAFLVQSTTDFSVDPSASKYWKNISFGDLEIDIKGSLNGFIDKLAAVTVLQNGSNGKTIGSISSADIDLSVLETSDANIILANGFGNLSSVDKATLNKIAQRASLLHKHTFVDLPAYTNFVDAKAWIEGIYNSEYVAVAGVDDIVLAGDDTTVSVWPSINYGIIYVNMLASTGTLYYPPAGYTTGNIVANNLRETDFKRYPDELKTARINWQRTTKKGSVMWEQRTTYSLNSDLSYIAPVFIVDGLRDSLIDYEENFNFRYTSPQDLLVQNTGLTSILDSFRDQGFLYDYKLSMPSYAEAQKAGRTLRIHIEIYITKDSEVIEIGVVLKNT